MYSHCPARFCRMVCLYRSSVFVLIDRLGPGHCWIVEGWFVVRPLGLPLVLMALMDTWPRHYHYEEGSSEYP
jgi:hypothetical protein